LAGAFFTAAFLPPASAGAATDFLAAETARAVATGREDAAGTARRAGAESRAEEVGMRSGASGRGVESDDTKGLSSDRHVMRVNADA
jgi:hypothetical protein